MLLVIDNYDSFTYNLVQYFGELGADVRVYRNDEITVDQIRELKPERLVISPGPGRPEQAGISVDVIKSLAGEYPILGVCLGHQCLGYAFGAEIIRAKFLMHGKTSLIDHDDKDLFSGLMNPFPATRYHSLVIDPRTLPKSLIVTARSDDDEIMGVRHESLPLWGVQFHPESILTEVGKDMLSNFIKMKCH
jgi:anthranilate synthase component 2